MVKYRPPWPKTPGERLAHYAWGSQDGAAAPEREEDEEWPPLQQHEDTERPMPASSGRVSPRVQRDRTIRRGRSLDRGDVLMHGADRALEEEEEPSHKQIMAAIQGCQTKLLDHFGEMLREKAQATDHRIAALEDTVRPMSTDTQVIKKPLSEHTLKMADMEDRMRRNNIRLVGLPEGVEGSHPEEFLEEWLKVHMAPGTFTAMFAIERAHRVPGKPPPKGATPRPMIAKILHFRDRENILKGARTGPELKFHNYRISIYPDFSATTQKQRAFFYQIKKRLRELNLMYSMLYPAKLRIVDNGKAHFLPPPQRLLTGWMRGDAREEGVLQDHLKSIHTDRGDPRG